MPVYNGCDRYVRNETENVLGIEQNRDGAIQRLGDPRRGHGVSSLSFLSYEMQREWEKQHPRRENEPESKPIQFTNAFQLRQDRVPNLADFEEMIKSEKLANPKTRPKRLLVPLGLPGHACGLIVDIDENDQSNILFFNPKGKDYGTYLRDAQPFIDVVRRNDNFPGSRPVIEANAPWQSEESRFCGDWTMWFLQNAATTQSDGRIHSLEQLANAEKMREGFQGKRGMWLEFAETRREMAKKVLRGQTDLIGFELQKQSPVQQHRARAFSEDLLERQSSLGNLRQSHPDPSAPPPPPDDLYQDPSTYQPAVVISNPARQSSQRESREASANNQVDPFYQEIGRAIEMGAAVQRSQTPKEGKQAHFQRQIDTILPYLNSQAQMLRDQINQDPTNKADLEKKLEMINYLNSMLLSMKSLSRNQSKYTEEWFNQHMLELSRKAGTTNEYGIIQAALRDIAKENFFKKGKNSTSFGGSNEERMAVREGLEKIPPVKIEHDKNGREVKATFSYGRNTLLRKDGGAFTTDTYSDFTQQIKDFANIAIAEYGKGTKNNPIKIFFTGPEQPEAALALLMEFKTRAILEGKTFHAVDNKGRPIEITPKDSLSEDEFRYFSSFANQKPQVLNSKGKKRDAELTAGACLMRAEGETIQNPEKISHHELNSMVNKRYRAEVDHRQQTSRTLETPSSVSLRN